MRKEFWYRTLFKLKIYEVSGDSFQRLFNDVMGYSYPDFQTVAPYGNFGDGGNDGWVENEKRYFQVYGKKADSKTDLSYILSKATGDFAKIQSTWGKIDYYHFVYNDRFEGAPAPVIKAVSELKTAHNIQESTVLDGRKLEAIFISLSDDQRCSILGGVPSEITDFIDSRLVAELLTYLADKALQSFSLLNQTAPDFDEKMQLNGLTEPVSSYLKANSYQTRDIEDFLASRDVGLKQSIAFEMQEIYQESLSQIPQQDDAANIRYVWMVEKLIPKLANQHPHTFKAYREAAQVILANYFEICDIYEHPSTITTA
ncbi:MAG: ABC-three component system protein [Sulfuricellaceae bacterium]